MKDDDFDALLDQARLPQRLERICLRGDLNARLQELDQQLAQARNSATATSLAGDGSQAIAQEIEAVRQQMAAASVPFRLTALSQPDFDAFIKGHPPRPEDRMDMISGYNRDTMGPALVRRCIVEPTMSDQRWERLLPVLSPAEFGKLDKAAGDLNFTAVSIPFSPAASPNPTSSGSE
jgi:hypothetical protein